MSDDAPKSAYELAMERLRKKDKEASVEEHPLTEKQKAAIESAKFADQKDDPTASTYALEFLRKHPEVASESVVWHTHDLTGDPIKQPAKIEYKYIPGAGF